MIRISAFKWVPDFARGQVGDLRVRWALEEAGLPYQVRLLDQDEKNSPEYCALQPFGQVPVFEEDGLVLFETGAIVLHVAQTHEGLLPVDADARARAIAWLFAALNTIEPPILERQTALLLERDRPWTSERMPLIEERVRTRLAQLSARLGAADWLDGGFSAGDLMMVMVLRWLKGSGLLEASPNLAAYVARGEARPAFQRAFAAQRAVFEAAEAAG